MTAVREQIIEATGRLLEAQGYHATGLNEIVAQSGAPKGSLYYYFPGGKEEMAAEAVARAGERLAQRIETNLGGDEPPAEAVRQFVRRIADGVEASGFRAGGPLLAVAMETVTDSERLNLACRRAYERLQQAFARRFEDGGCSAERAAQLATFVTAAIEGGIILSRTNHSGEALRCVAQELGAWLEGEGERSGIEDWH